MNKPQKIRIDEAKWPELVKILNNDNADQTEILKM